MKQRTHLHVAELGPNKTLLFKKTQKPILLQASLVLGRANDLLHLY